MRGRSGGRPAGRSDVVASGEVLGRRRRGDPATARDQWRIRAMRARCRWGEAAARNAGDIAGNGQHRQERRKLFWLWIHSRLWLGLGFWWRILYLEAAAAWRKPRGGAGR